MSVGSLEWRRQEGAGGRRRQGGRRPPPLALRGCTHIWRAVKGMSNAMPDKIPADAKADFIGKVLNRPANRAVPVSAEGVEEEGHGWAGRGQTGRHGEGQVDSGEEKKGGTKQKHSVTWWPRTGCRGRRRRWPRAGSRPLLPPAGVPRCRLYRPQRRCRTCLLHGCERGNVSRIRTWATGGGALPPGRPTHRGSRLCRG